MNFLKSVAIAFSMYSRIPMPSFEWKKENMKYSICFFPFVGLVISFIMAGVYFLFETFLDDIPYVARALFIVVIPVIVSGGIHLDGYMDTCDSLSSFQDKEKRLEILSDPHIGAFAVIRLLVYGCLFFAMALCVTNFHLGLDLFFAWALIFFLSRILSGIAVVSFKCAKSKGTLYTFAEGADKTKCIVLLIIEATICIFFMIYLGKMAGFFESLISVVTFIYYYHMSGKKYGGITGDLAGYFVCICELCAGIVFMIFMMF